MGFRLILFALLALFSTFGPTQRQSRGIDEPRPADVSFTADIKPLLQAKCIKCHGEKIRKADLDLSSTEGLLKGGESGSVLVAGKPEKSLLFEKVHSGTMPPGKKDQLSAADVETFRRWIVAGAKVDTGMATTSAVTQHDVIPIMLRHCTACHGTRKQEAGLDLRTKAGMLRGGKSGPAIVPGKPVESLIVKQIQAGRMPPFERLVEACVKPVDPAETNTLVKWIAAGAPEVAVRPDVATTTPDTLVSDRDREFWSFQPPKPVVIPTVKNAAQVRNPIDAFILAKLEAAGLTLAPEADRATLMRRVSFDLTGLPPEPAEVKAFLADTSPDAYEKLIDRLLASPRYGERWGRFWLDLAGYADSEGKREQDLPRPHAWRYRDYVIRSLNDDKPYDRFLLEQLAGDELHDFENAAEITPAMADCLVATGFLRMAPDPTWANITGFVPDRLDVISDEMDVLGSGVLGLTMKCARCHSHKFDPIPQRDYYRLVDVFKGALDEYDWLKPEIRPGIGPVSMDVTGGRHLPFVATAERRAWLANTARIQGDAEAVKAALEAKAAATNARVTNDRIARLPDVLRDDLKAMLATFPEKRDVVQQYLAGKFEAQLRFDRAALPGLDVAFKKESDAAEFQVKRLLAQLPSEPRVQALWDRGEPSPTYLYRRGDPLSPGQLVGPGVPSVLTDGKSPFDVKPPWPGAKKTGRRLAFAKWVTRPDHPLTARVQVNRLWKHHFGSGIVATLGNFGKAGSPPSHPELHDWLAREFVQRGWGMKAMHRLMMTSSTYRQSSFVTPEHQRLDPGNALVSRMPLTRLDAESLYDSLLLVAGRLNETRHGPADVVQVRPDGLVTPVGTEKGWRRIVYVKQTRKAIPTHLETFDFPQMNPNCLSRRDSTVAPQALHLMNSAMVDDLADEFAKRIRREAGTDPVRQIEAIYWIALGRPPTAAERKSGEAALAKLTDEWAAHLTASGAPDRADVARKALATYCHAMMNSASFLYVD